MATIASLAYREARTLGKTEGIEADTEISEKMSEQTRLPGSGNESKRFQKRSHGRAITPTAW
ncbi:hypothetical protein RSSM_00140 [Rhodopirellula sallentina SM41]|uniref:Uncharacterized protein n=1 Tax=Rhodopirellula sallentina SM41 TaxID=1263870 RepID=M5UQZ7_9BACT|nr:hypothetical protein RSSM_00140 [Rhodopirellula sallentina SM41]